jgi:hypothetical protein
MPYKAIGQLSIVSVCGLNDLVSTHENNTGLTAPMEAALPIITGYLSSNADSSNFYSGTLG